MTPRDKREAAELTRDRLMTMLRYHPDTGVFSRLVRTRGRAPGSIAGGFNPYIGGYVIIGLGRRDYRAHRLAWLWMTGEWPVEEIDHINGNGADNRWANLRLANHSQNNANRSRQSNNTSGFKGVSFFKWGNRSNRWLARIVVGGECHRLGYFATAEEAHAAYRAAASEFFGEFAHAGT